MDRQGRQAGRLGANKLPLRPVRAALSLCDSHKAEAGEAGQRHRPGRRLRHGGQRRPGRKLGDYDLAVAGLDAGRQDLVQTGVERAAAGSPAMDGAATAAVAAPAAAGARAAAAAAKPAFFGGSAGFAASKTWESPAAIGSIAGGFPGVSCAAGTGEAPTAAAACVSTEAAAGAARPPVPPLPPARLGELAPVGGWACRDFKRTRLGTQ